MLKIGKSAGGGGGGGGREREREREFQFLSCEWSGGMSMLTPKIDRATQPLVTCDMRLS